MHFSPIAEPEQLRFWVMNVKGTWFPMVKINQSPHQKYRFWCLPVFGMIPLFQEV
jgi:hypothetical protein